MEWDRGITEALGAPFADEEVEFLPKGQQNGRARAVAYISARSVMRRLDAVVGPENWWFDFDLLSPDGKLVRGRLTVLGVTKCDAGEADTESEALKSAVSDALKRCGVHFGIGRYLYAVPPIWVPYDSSRRHFAETPRIPDDVLRRALAISTVAGYAGSGEPGVPASGARSLRRTNGRVAESAPAYAPAPATGGAPPESSGDRAASRESEGDPATGEHRCIVRGCNRPLTPAQARLSVHHYGEELCPGCQKSRVRSPNRVGAA